MASTNTSSAANASSTGFPGDEFANNLFSDLAPLLTLFGEQVTKQFLSLSIGWADNFMLAMAPLGILTVVVSAIRVTKDRYMKALVGRARESRAMAEAELLSSTSDEVCELFDGNQIVRVLGEPDTQEFVYRESFIERGYHSKAMVWGLREAWDAKVLRFVEIDSGNTGKFAAGLRWIKNALSPHGLRALVRRRSHPAQQDPYLEQKTIEQSLIDGLLLSAPNIILNVPEAVAPKWELWVFAWVGIIAQLAVLVFGALTTYHWKFEKGGAPIALYGYPCTMAGTLTVSLGLLLCSHVIEGSTDECKLQLGHSYDYGNASPHRILRIQRACIVSEQHFSSYALFNSKSTNFLRTSRLNKDRDYNVVAAIGSFIAITGFIVQFVGLRALHWSATIMQLGATVFMTAVRSYVRRGLAHDMDWEAIPEGEELAWFTEYICHTQGLEGLSGSYVPYDNEPQTEDRPYTPNDPKLEAEVLFYSLPPRVGRKTSKPEKEVLEEKALLEAIPLSPILQNLPKDWKVSQTPEGLTCYVNHNLGVVELNKPPRSIDGNSIAIEMIDQQSRLASMSKWGEPQSEVAQQLISAMLQIRELIEDPENAQSKQKRTDAYGPRETRWAMKMILHPDNMDEPRISRPRLSEVDFELPRINPESEDRDPSKKLRMNVGTLLSLWLRTINKRSKIPEWKLGTPSALRRNESMEREMRVQPKTVFLRVVASESTGDPDELEKLELLERWLETPVFRVPCPKGDTSLSLCGGALGVEPQGSSSWQHLVHHHPVFGLEFSSLYKANKIDEKADLPFTEAEMLALQRHYKENKPPWCPETEYERTYGSSHFLSDGDRWPEGMQLPDTCTPEKLSANKDYLRRRLQPELAIHCQGTLVQNCALEIFSTFLMEATADVEKLLGTTVFKATSLDLPREEFPDEAKSAWRNDVIDKMARVLFDSGFVESSAEGRNVIVPVLAARGLLPTEESSRVKPQGPLDRWLIQL